MTSRITMQKWVDQYYKSLLAVHNLQVTHKKQMMVKQNVNTKLDPFAFYQSEQSKSNNQGKQTKMIKLL